MYVNGHEQNHRVGVPPLWQNPLHGRHSFDNTCLHDPFGQDDGWWTSLETSMKSIESTGWLNILYTLVLHTTNKMFWMTAGSFQRSRRPCDPLRRSAAERWWAKVLKPDKKSSLLSRFRWESLFVFNMREMNISSLVQSSFFPPPLYFLDISLNVTINLFIIIAPAGISPRGTLVARAYIKDSTYRSNIQSVY